MNDNALKNVSQPFVVVLCTVLGTWMTGLLLRIARWLYHAAFRPLWKTSGPSKQPHFLCLTIAAGLLVATACGDDDDSAGGAGAVAGQGGSPGAKAGTGGAKATAGSGGAGSVGADDAGTALSAADLRTTLNLLLSEHATLAAKATAAALGGRNDELEAYGDLLNQNGNDVGELVGAAYGSSAQTMFNGIWSAHNGYFVDYTKGVAAKDDGMKQAAVDNLTMKYVPDFAKFLAPATGLDEKAIADLTAEHVTTTKDVVDAQAAALASKSKADWTAAYANYRKAFAHMRMIGDALSEAIAGKMPGAFKGDPKTKAVDLRVGLNEALQEHMYLATFATGAALGSRMAEFEAAGDALNANGNDIGDVIGSLYGDDAKTTFNGIWSAHNGYFVAYTTGVAMKDKSMMNAAVNDLTTKYVPMFAAFLHTATDLPEETLKSLTMAHVVMTKAVVDAQAANKPADAAKADVEGARHLQMIGDPLSAAIVKKLPSKF